MTQNTRSIRKKKKKKILLTALLIPFVFISILSIVALVDYKKALKTSREESVFTDEEVEFNAPKIENNKFNILLLGVDAKSNEERARTDTIMIAHYDGKREKLKITSIMRDSYVNIPDYGYNKINAAYALGGIELLRKTLKNNFDLDTHYYAIVNFTSFSKIIDISFPEGVEINIEKEMSKGIKNTLQPGIQNLNGDQLLDYVRFRQDIESDFGRVRRQQEVLQILKKEFSNLDSLVKLPRIIGTIEPHIKTNINTTLGLSLINKLPSDDENKIETLRIPADNTYTNERYQNIGAVLELDIEENKRLLKSFIDK